MKSYTLDLIIYSVADRLAFVLSQLLDSSTSSQLSSSDLEALATYILSGNNREYEREGYIYTSSTRYSSYRRKSQKNLSLETVLENAPQQLRRPHERMNYTSPRKMIKRDAETASIPGMRELWDTIDRMAECVEKWKNDPEMQYRVYKMRHHLIATRLDQYVLRDCYRPEIRLQGVTHSSPHPIEWDGDAFYWITKEEWERKLDSSYYPYSRDLAKYERKLAPDGTLLIKWHVRYHNFDWLNYKHIGALIKFREEVTRQNEEHPDSWGRVLTMDLERFLDIVPMREDWRACAWWYGCYRSAEEVREKMMEVFHYAFSASYIIELATQKVPMRIVEWERKQLALKEWDGAKRVCRCCKRELPLSGLFFGKDNANREHFMRNCKDCVRKKRKEEEKEAEQEKQKGGIEHGEYCM